MVTVQDLLKPSRWGLGATKQVASYKLHPALLAALKEVARERVVSVNALVAETLLSQPDIKKAALRHAETGDKV